VQEAAIPWFRQQHKELSQHFEEEKKSLTLPRIEPWIVQPVA
jgi:hypothetical protein